MADSMEQVIERIREVLNVHTYLEEDEGGSYYGEIYADYNDELRDETVRRIFACNSPRETFYDVLNDIFFDADVYEYKSVYEALGKHFEDEAEGLVYSEHEDFIRDWVNENVHFNYPYDHYLKQNVCLNIMVDTGDGDYDFTLNNFFNWYADRSDEREISELSSLVWLMKQQGYTTEQVHDFIRNENTQGSKFLESVKQESENCSTSMSAVTFFVKMTLKEAMDLHERLYVGERGRTLEEYEAHEDKLASRKGTLVIEKGAMCGLFDPWGGAGGLLGIELERDVELPIKLIDSALPDGGRGYSAANVYGMRSWDWSDCGVKLVGEEAA